MAARPIVVFTLHGQLYGLDLRVVDRLLRVVAITPVVDAPTILRGVIDLAGTVLPVVDMRHRFNHPPRELRLSDQLLVTVFGTRTAALLVDDTVGVQQVSAKDWGEASELLPGVEFDGAVKLHDGLVLILDLERLLSPEQAKAVDQALESAQ